MAVSVVAEGSLVADGSEQSIHDTTDPGTFTPVIDLAPMQLGDTVRVRVYSRARTGGAKRIMFEQTLSNAQTEPILISAPIGAAHGFELTLEQTAGTFRTFPYSIEQIGDVTELDDSATTMDGSEQTLIAFTSNRNAWIVLDLVNLQAGDTVVMRMYRKARDTTSSRVYVEHTFSGAQSEPISVSVAMPCPYGATFTLEQTAGTFRQIPWSARAAA